MHKATIVESKRTNGSYLSVRTRCCGDASTDEWHSVEVSPDRTQDDIVSLFKLRLADHEMRHANLLQAEAIAGGIADGTIVI